jgi:hypothetical protein
MEPHGYRTIHYTELPPAKQGEPLSVEWELYRHEVGGWLAEGHEGRWVLIKEEVVIGFFDTREAAMEEANKRYLIPRQPFMVRQILTRERIIRCNWMWRPRRCPTPPCP